MTYGAPNFAGITRRQLNKQELVAELEPMAPSHRGFEVRLPPVTEADHVAVGLAVNAQKSSPDWDGLSIQFAHAGEVQRARGSL